MYPKQQTSRGRIWSVNLGLNRKSKVIKTEWSIPKKLVRKVIGKTIVQKLHSAIKNVKNKAEIDQENILQITEKFIIVYWQGAHKDSKIT